MRKTSVDISKIVKYFTLCKTQVLDPFYNDDPERHDKKFRSVNRLCDSDPDMKLTFDNESLAELEKELIDVKLSDGSTIKRPENLRIVKERDLKKASEKPFNVSMFITWVLQGQACVDTIAYDCLV